jgi:hypothetical protein
LLRHAQCILNLYNANLLSQSANEANLGNSDAVIDAGIADIYSYTDMTLATLRSILPKRSRNKKALPGNLIYGRRGWETNPLLTEIKDLGAMG